MGMYTHTYIHKMCVCTQVHTCKHMCSLRFRFSYTGVSLGDQGPLEVSLQVDKVHRGKGLGVGEI